MESSEEMDRRLRAELPPEPAINWREPFSAIYEGARHNFRAVEHFSIGPGWMCREIDGNLPNRIYSSYDLTEYEQR